ncbi:MAG: copper homeostasis protein CutC [Bacteroidales bacterium]|jgi:copper homeostasis protein
MQFILEICTDSVESAVIAQQSGADRIELCDNLAEGGTTPGPGRILSARSNLDIPLHVLIRPRGSDFLYSDIEFDEMRRDIEVCGEEGVEGVVLGILRKDGNIDMEKTSRLVELAHPMKVTFHRAFDLCVDPVRGIEDIIKTGASRLLTSGQKNRAIEGTGLLASLVELAAGRIIVMPGSGINVTNIAEIARITKASEFHLTGRKAVESEMEFRRTGIMMGSIQDQNEFTRKIADEESIRKIAEILKMI